MAAVATIGLAGCSSADRQHRIIDPDPATLSKYVDDEAAEDPQRSLTGLTRENWEPVRVSAVRGFVPHYPKRTDLTDICGTTWRYTPERPSPLTPDGSAIEVQAARATDDAKFNRWDKNDWKDTGVGMLMVGHEIMFLPLDVIDHPPGEVQLSPQQ